MDRRLNGSQSFIWQKPVENPGDTTSNRKEEKWTVYSSNQNLSSVLNDPALARSVSDTIFTKDWGTYFVDTGSVPPSVFIPKISHLHFQSYLKRVSKRSKSLQRIESRNSTISVSSPDQTLDKSKPSVPSVFTDPNFNLENVETFNTILSLSKSHRSSNSDPGFKLHKKDIKEMEGYLSDYLDNVEEHLAKQISVRFRDFFHIMNAMDVVMDQLTKTIKEVTLVRKKCDQLEKAIVTPTLKNIQLTKRRTNATEICEKLKLMATLHQTQPTVQLLLATSDYVGALDLINTSQEVVSQDLAGLHSFRYFKSQLNEIERVIFKMMQDEFVKFAAADWNRPLETPNHNDKYILVEEERLSSITLGMIKLQKFNFVDMFREEALTAIKAVVKQLVIEALSKEDDLDVGERVDDGLFDQLKRISFVKWMALLEDIFNNLLILLKRIEAIHCVMLQSVDYANGIDSMDNLKIEDGLKNIPQSDLDKLRTSITESLCAICDFAHSMCGDMVVSKAKDKSLDKLTSSEFTLLAKTVENFTTCCELICGRRSPKLKLVLQTQANKFVSRFHDERRKKLKSLLDIEQWKSLDAIPNDFQNIIDQITVKNIKLNELNKNSTNCKEEKPKPFVWVNNEKFVIVTSVITLITMIIEYCQCASEIRALSPDFLTRLLDLLKQFNSRTSQLVLNAAAVQVAGLKTITVRNLIVSSRCLQLVLLLIPYVKYCYQEILPEKQSSMVKHFDEISRNYKEHINKIPEKIVGVVRELISVQLMKWEAKPPVPSPQFQAVSSHIMRLHDNIQDALPKQELAELFDKIHHSFKETLRQNLLRLAINNDGGPQHGLVTQELIFYTQNLNKLFVARLIKINNDDLWVSTKS